MRTLFGMVLGAGLTVGAAYMHDRNVTYDPINPRVTDQQIVNWDVFGAVLRQVTDGLSTAWKGLTGK
jgi:hypothetical protein